MAKANTVVKGFSLPDELYESAKRKAKTEDRNFSSYVRRVIKDDLVKAGYLTPPTSNGSGGNEHAA